MNHEPAVHVIYLNDMPGRPKHVHTCVDSSGAHQWACDSAYCEVMQRTCVDHGGKPPRSNDASA